MKIDLSIIVPCYNEAGNIPTLIDRLREVQKANQELQIEFILVNNGSSDNSARVLEQSIIDGEVIIATVEKNIGYGNGILQGLAVANGEALAWTHADLQTDIADVVEAYRLYKNNEGVVVKGKRKNRAILERIFTFGMQVIVNIVLKTYLDDINAQPKLFSKNFYMKYIKDRAPLDFSLDLFLLYTAKERGYKILTIPVYFKKRLHGEAKGGGSWKGRIKLIKRTWSYIFQLKESIASGKN